jgi:hypothetical protein
MKANNDKVALRWYMRCVRLTPEYFGGLLAGLGVGIMAMTSLIRFDIIRDHRFLIGFLGIVAVAVGASIALYAQNRHDNH